MAKKKKKARMAGQELSQEQGQSRAGPAWRYPQPAPYPPPNFPWLPIPLNPASAPWFSRHHMSSRARFMHHMGQLPPLRPPCRRFMDFQQGAAHPFIHSPQAFPRSARIPRHAPLFRDTRQDVTNAGFYSPPHAQDRQDVANAPSKDKDICIQPHASVVTTQQGVSNAANKDIHTPLHALVVMDTQQDVTNAASRDIHIPPHTSVLTETQQGFATSPLNTAKRGALVQPAEQKNVGGSKCLEVRKAPLKRKRDKSKASKPALWRAIKKEGTEQAAFSNEVVSVQVQVPTQEEMIAKVEKIVTTQQDVSNAANKDIHTPLHALVVVDTLQDVTNAAKKNINIPPHAVVFMDTQQGFATSPFNTAKKETHTAQPKLALGQPAEQKNAGGSKCAEVKNAPLKRKRGKSKASKPALSPAITKEDTEQAAPSNEVVSVQVRAPTPKEMIARVEKAATKAHKKLLAQGKAVVVLDVVQESLRSLGYMSLESIGLCMYDVPCLHKLIKLEAKLNMLIACHVAVRKITTLHDLSEEILSAENVKSFDELGIGPLSLHPPVVQLFAPPVGSKIYKITAMDVLNYLTEYLDKYADDSLSNSKEKGFLSYIVKLKSLPSAAHLCVRIENFGLYASYIWREKKVNIKVTSHKKAVSSCKVKSQGTNVKKKTAVKKAQVGSIARRRAQSFSTKGIESSRHIVFVSSDEEHDKENISSKLAGSKRDALTSNQSNCPYPSLTEERLRFLAKIPSKGNAELQEYALPTWQLKAFIATWRDICLRYPIDEVLQRIHASGAHMDAFENRQKPTWKRLLKSFKLYPAIGILNVAVLFMKSGHWKSLLDAYEERPNNQIERTKNDDKRTVLEIPADQKAFSKHDTSEEQPARSSEEVLEEVIRILHEMNAGTVFGLREQGMLDEQCFCTMVKRIMSVEKDLVDRLLIKRFSDLRLGCFPDFIEVYWNRIEKECAELYKSMARKMLYGNGVSEERVRSFLSQVKTAVGDRECLTEHDFVMQLLAKQFSSHRVGDWCSSIVQELTDCLKGADVPGCTFFFSSALLATKANSTQGGSHIGVAQDNDLVEAFPMPQTGLLGSLTSADAKHCLVKAPMLCDLLKWSQWDSVFFPLLGSFPSWLEKECPIEGLICLATSDGKYLRIDGSATVDTFLAAMAKGCGKQAALQFVSVVAVYGGVDRVPQTLLKSYAHQAFQILVGNPPMVGQTHRKVSISKNHRVINAFEEGVSFIKSDPFQTWGEDEPCDKYRGVIHFVFDMLAHLPSEFVVYAASIVVPALSKIVPGATTAMLRTYGTADHLMSLHEIGLSLGVIDWVSNFQSLFLACPVSSVETRVGFPLQKKHIEENIRQVSGEDKASSLEKHIEENIRQASGEDKTSFLEKHIEENIRQVSGEDKASSLSKSLKNIACKNDTVTADGESGVQDLTKCEKEAVEVIAVIRKEEFGMDMNLSSKESDLLAKQHARIGRALQCLSQELYSQDTHFVLELVQNADDNQYAHGVEATLVFILESQRVVVVNNELGFTPANIRALCDVGSSTKAGSSAGYIGHKGIGFKSVFCVSDAPEVHSRGFHVKFDISEGNIGFVLPTTIPPFSNWELIEEVLTASQAFKEEKSSTWNTCLLLPLKPSIQDGPDIQMLSTKLNDIQPSLLLFLHRLERIIIKNSLSGTLRVLQRCNSDDGLFRISDGTGSAIWFVVKQQFGALVERPGVTMTEIALAFPLREVSSGVYEACNEHQQVFAFLPLRSYGLRFIIQGDFILPSSREELDVDSAWNQWLFSEVPGVFAGVVETLKELACFKQFPGRAASLFLSFIPLEGEVQGIFGSLPRMILARLRASQCLPVEAREGEWALPCVLLGGWTEFSRTLIPDQLLREHLGLYYLHRDVVINPAVAHGLGIHMYGSRMLINLMESVCLNKDALQVLGPRWISSWFVALTKCSMSEAEDATYFSQPRFEPEDIEKLKHIPCIPLSNGTYTSLEEGSVWLPCIDTGSADDAATLLEDFPLIYSQLRTVHALMLDPRDLEVNQWNPTTYSAAEKGEFKSLIFSMLYQLGVRQLLGHELMTRHILSSMASNDFLEKPKPVVVQYLAFVMVHLLSNCKQCKVDRSNIMAQLKRIAVIATKDGLKRVNAGFLHFGAEFDCKIEVKEILEGLQVGWTEIDPAYLEACNGSPGRASLSQWRQFFKDLGVTDFVRVIRKQPDKLKSIEGEVDDVAVCDWECPELATILERFCISDINVPNKNSKLSRLISAFDSLWDECYSKHSAISWSDGREKKMAKKNTVASFVSQMRSFAWVQSSIDLKLYQPCQLYYRCSAVESILGTHAPYPVPQTSCINFVEALGFKVNVSVSDVLDLLKVWNQYTFKTSVSQMTQLYNFIWNGAALHKEYVVDFFEKEACIFVPSKRKAKADAPSKGRFYPSNRLFWEDSTGSLAKLLQSKDASTDVSDLRICPKALNTFYPTLHGFFVEICHVQATLSFDDYFSVLKILADHFPPQHVLPEVLAVLLCWSHDIDTSRVKPSEVWKWKELLQRKHSRILPTLQDKWVSLDDSAGLVCWCDDEALGEQFSAFKNVFYVCVSSIFSKKADRGNASIQTAKLMSFFQAMSIPPLSKVVRREPIVHGARWSKQMFDMLCWSLPYAQRYMQKWHGDIYGNLKKSVFVTRIKKIQCIHSDRLFFCYKLPGEIGSGKKQFETEHLFQGDTLYATNLENLNALYLEFSRLFFDGNTNLQLANFLHLVTLSSQSGSKENELEALLASQGIGPFPDVKNQWTLDCLIVDGLQATQCIHAPDDMSKQGVNDANNTSPLASWRRTRENTHTINRVAACQKSLAAVMHQIEAKAKFKSKERQLEGEGQDKAPLFESRSLVVPGKVGSKSKDPPAMFEDVMVPLKEKSRASKDALDACTESARGRAGTSKKFASIDGNVQGRLVVTNPSHVLHKDGASNCNKLQGELGASNLVSMPEDTRFVNFSNRDFGHPSEEQVALTGRLGEALVFNHLMEKYGPGCVSWMNAEKESGLPYDIVVDGFCGKKLLVEVKATCSEHKDWFEISSHEWEYAAHAGERFVIIRVFLGGRSGSARFVWLPNPLKLCRDRMIKLALIFPQQQHPADYTGP